MKIKRVYKKTSLKFGQEEIVDEGRMRLIAGQTAPPNLSSRTRNTTLEDSLAQATALLRST